MKEWITVTWWWKSLSWSPKYYHKVFAFDIWKSVWTLTKKPQVKFPFCCMISQICHVLSLFSPQHVAGYKEPEQSQEELPAASISVAFEQIHSDTTWDPRLCCELHFTLQLTSYYPSCQQRPCTSFSFFFFHLERATLVEDVTCC